MANLADMQVGILAEADIWIILAVMLVVVALGLVIFVFSRYRRCPSNKILVIYGKTGKRRRQVRARRGGVRLAAAPGLRLHGPGAVRRAHRPDQRPVAGEHPRGRADDRHGRHLHRARHHGERRHPPAGPDRAADPGPGQDIILGQMRAVIATMRIDDINRDRQAFMAKVNEAVGVELEKIGLALINVNIRDIEDESGYIKAIGRKAAAEAINQANIDVAEQERTRPDRRGRTASVTPAWPSPAANADAEIGEANAAENKRQQMAAPGRPGRRRPKPRPECQKAGYRANQSVAEQDARSRQRIRRPRPPTARSASRRKSPRRRPRTPRPSAKPSRLNAEIVVPAQGRAQQKVVIAAEAAKQQAIRIAEARPRATLAKMRAAGRRHAGHPGRQGRGLPRTGHGRAQPQAVAALLIIEKLADVASIQAQAIQDLPIEKIIVWDSGRSDGGSGGNGNGNGGGLAGLGGRLIGALPPMHELAKQDRPGTAQVSSAESPTPPAKRPTTTPRPATRPRRSPTTSRRANRPRQPRPRPAPPVLSPPPRRLRRTTSPAAVHRS